MDKKELKDKYQELYAKMANGKNVENMELFGRVMTNMMHSLIESNPEQAEKYIEQLEAVKWKNYLTRSEAEGIVEAMEPEAPWGYEQWKKSMGEYGYETQEWPYYNQEAMYTTMNMIMSDSGSTIAKYVNGTSLFKFVHELAVDKLKDKDGVFRIRRYFNL